VRHISRSTLLLALFNIHASWPEC